MSRGAILLGYGLVGYFIGAFVLPAVLMVPAMIFPLPDVLVHGPTSFLGGIVGAGAGLFFGRASSGGGESSQTHGSARFSTVAEMRGSLGPHDGLIVGRAPSRSGQGALLRYAGPSHLLTIAPTRSGKGVGAVIPNLLTQDRSIVCIDPKGENAAIAAQTRSSMGPVYVLDPFAVSGEPSAAFNPLSALDPKSLDLAEDVAELADALVFDPSHQTGDAHWNEEAKALITGVILHVVTTEPSATRHLGAVREALTSAPDQFLSLLDAMQSSSAAGGLVARAANRHLSKSDREASGVLSAAQRHTHFLDSPRISQVLSRSDFVFQDLKRANASVFLVLPPDRLATQARWLRMMVVQALSALVRSGTAVHPDQKPVLFLLDEFAALGHLASVERAFGLMAGYGVQLWAILQDLHQLRSTYGRQAGTFLSNAGVIQLFNVADIDTAQWVSRTMGSSTQSYYTTSTSTPQNPLRFSGISTSKSLNVTRRELMTPDEVMRLSADQLLLLRPGERPVLAQKVRYYDGEEFQGLF